MKIIVIDRGRQPHTGVLWEIVRRGNAVERQETREVPCGTETRRTILYPSLDAYAAAKAGGRLEWLPWL